MAQTTTVPKAFFWRRLHSLTGLWLVIFLMEHLLTNSQAALWIGDDGHGFVRFVNLIHNLPYLPVIEIGLLAFPILLHGYWGIHYLRTGNLNSMRTDGSKPSLPEYSRNKAYTWQRITSWILLFALVGHVVQMRFLEYPASASVEGQKHYMVRIGMDEGLYTLSNRLNVRLYDQRMIEIQRNKTSNGEKVSVAGWLSFFNFNEPESGKELLQKQKTKELQNFIEALEAKPLKEGEVIAVANEFGTAVLLTVRQTFKSPLMLVLYTVFVLSACFHAFNGLWTFLITWGISLTSRSQIMMRRMATGLMLLIAFLGLAAIWGTYWINLRY